MNDGAIGDIGRYRQAIKDGLHGVIAGRLQASDGTIPWGRDVLERLEPFATSGKLLRGSVLCFAYEAFSGKAPGEPVLSAAIGLELTHSALLVHDDIMDDDGTRRGRPSMHRQYQAAGESLGLPGGTRFGVNMALSAGDAALFMAFGLMATAGAAAGGDAAYGMYVDQLLATCAGQMQDVYLDATPRVPAKKEILDLMRTKTAAYTLALPLTMGAALAGAPPAVIRRLRSIGIAGGTIFQIRDDELGVMGDPLKTGKPVGSDIREGKKTLLYYYLLKASSQAERAKLSTIFGDPKASDRDIAYVQKLVVKHDIARLLGNEIEPLQMKAIKEISRLSISQKARDGLAGLIAFCAARQY